MSMLMMLMMMKLEQVPTFFCLDTAMPPSTVRYIECAFALNVVVTAVLSGCFPCSVEDKPVYCMLNFRRVSLVDNAFY